MTEPNKTELAPTSVEKPSTLALRVKEEDLVALENLATECAQLATKEVTPFRRTFLMAAGMAKLRSLITREMMHDVMCLQGSSLGFRTDKDDKGGYDVETVKEVAIEATLRGLRLVGNEINIIANRCYAAKDGLKRLVREWPGLTNLRLRPGIPSTREGYTIVPIVATWKIHGVEQVEDCTGDNAIPIRVNREQIVDAIIGKAIRKMYARIYDRLTGQPNGLIEAEDEAIEVESSGVESREARVESQKTNSRPSTPNSQLSEEEWQDQEYRIAKYAQDLGMCEHVNQVASLMRKAREETGLRPESRTRITDLGNERITAIRNGRGDRSQRQEN
jgi:hypothetical protein